jgi:hypothetical protein
MAEIIQIIDEDKRPKIICSKCKEQIMIDIRPFEKDCTKVIRDKCPKCFHELFVGILILAHHHHLGLLQSIQTIAEAMDKNKQIIGGKPVDQT